MKLDFDPAAHVYRIDGAVVPSVTQVLAPLECFDGIPPAVLERARIRGQHVHEAMALLVRDDLDWSSLDHELVPYIEGGKRFLDESGLTVIASELPVGCHVARCAGTLDLAAYWHKSEAILDFKATAAIPPTVAPQTAGYERLYRSMLGGKQRKRYAVHLTPRGYKVHPLTDPADYAIFQSALNVHHWRHRHAA